MTDVFEIEVPKTVGDDGKSSLRIDIRTDEEVLGRGLFIYGFLPDSSAEQQGLLHVGDELLMVNDVDVEGGDIPDLVSAMQSEEYADATSVPVMVRRQGDQSRHVSTVSTPFVPLTAVQENIHSPYSHNDTAHFSQPDYSHPEEELPENSVGGNGSKQSADDWVVF
jgi:C-terminal processing protease CtpA/Prc